MKERGRRIQEENTGTKDPAAFDELLNEGRDSKRKKRGILVLAIILAAWFLTWALTGSLLFGWIPAVIIIMLVRALYWDKPIKVKDQKLRRH